MTVAELIEELSSYDPKTEVMFSYNYGDYWRTEVASEVELVEETLVTYSSYHDMYKVDEDSDNDGELSDDSDDEKKNKTVVILK